MSGVIDRSAVVPGYVLAAVLAFVPSIGVVVPLAVWRDNASQVPVHWSGATADGFESSVVLFWSALIPSLVIALICAAMALLLDDGSGRWGTALAFGALVLFGAAVSMQWPVAQITAADSSLKDAIGRPFLLYLAAIPLAGTAWTVAAFWRKRPHRPRPA